MSVRTRTLSPRAAATTAGAIAVLAVLSLSGAAWAATDTLRDPDLYSHPMTHMDSSVLAVRFSGQQIHVEVYDGSALVAERTAASAPHHGLPIELLPGAYDVTVTLDGVTGAAQIRLDGMVHLDARIVDGELVLEASEGHMMSGGMGGMGGHMGGMGGP